MEQETITPGWGSPESATWFRGKLTALGLSQHGLARLMLDLGDDRQLATILRCLSRMASGEARVAGEMRAFLGILERFKGIQPEAGAIPDAARTPAHKVASASAQPSRSRHTPSTRSGPSPC